MSEFKKGDIVRYSNGPTALAQLIEKHPSAEGWHARQCLGGNMYVSGFEMASLADIERARQSPHYKLDTPLEPVEPLTFDKLREVNADRNVAWSATGDTGEGFNSQDFFTEFMEEIGEAAGAIKRLRRIQLGIAGAKPENQEEYWLNLQEEFGDIQICLDNWAKSLNINLGECTRMKFNKTSDKHGFPHKL